MFSIFKNKIRIEFIPYYTLQTYFNLTTILLLSVLSFNTLIGIIFVYNDDVCYIYYNNFISMYYYLLLNINIFILFIIILTFFFDVLWCFYNLDD